MHNPRFQIEPAWRMLVADLKLDLRTALERAQLPADLFTRADARLALPEYLRLWRALESAMRDPAFPVELVPLIRHEGFDPALFAAFCSPDLNTALQRLARFKPLIGPLSLSVDVGETTTSLEVRVHGVDAAALPAAMVGTELVFFVHLARSGTGLRVCPRRVWSPVDLPGLAQYRAFLGAPVGHGPRTRIEFDAADACAPFVSRNEAMWEHFEPALQQRLDRLNAQASTAERVRACLLERLPGGEAAVAQVAGRLLMSTRTLQRRLGEEGTSYHEVLRAVRSDLARHYLAQPELSGTQIAYLLGFDDPASFSRAYRGWTGTTPEQVRSGARP